MIIRKPFKFLIRNFKIINLLLLILIVYVTSKCGIVSSFFNTYVENGYITKEMGLANKYIGFILPVVIIIIVLISGIIYYLFKTKDKEKEYRVYLYMIVFYIVLLIVSLITKGILDTYELTTIEASTALMYRDLSRFFFYPNFIFIIACFLNTIGFNIQRFEFMDLKDEIDIEEEDNALVEVNIGLESYKIKRTFRRTLRELKYYFIENKLVFSVIGGIIGLICLFFVGRFVFNLNKTVRISESFNHQNFNIAITDSLITTLDYQGNTIRNDTYYLAIKVNIVNKSNKSLVLDTDNFWLDMGSYYLYPTLDRSGKFVDLGEPYFGEKIAAKENHNYILVYELNNKEIRNKYTIKILDTINYQDGVANPKYKKITITPKLYTSIHDNDTYNLNDYVLLNDTLLLNTSIKVLNYSITSLYNYYYEYCQDDICIDKVDAIGTGSDVTKTLLILNSDLNIDSNSTYKQFKKDADFYADFATIEYSMYGNNYVSKVKNRTSNNDKSKSIVLEVDYNITKADNITLVITIRNQRTKIVLK